MPSESHRHRFPPGSGTSAPARLPGSGTSVPARLPGSGTSVPVRLLLGLCLLLALAPHVVGQDGAGEGQDPVEVTDVEELIDRMEGDRADIREQQAAPDKSMPENRITLSPLVRRIIDDELTTDTQRRQLRLFHGQWEALGDLEKLPRDERAQLALLRYELHHPSLGDPQTDPRLRAEAALRRGDADRAIDLLDGVEGIEAMALRGRAHETAGRLPKAVEAYEAVRAFIRQRGQVERDPAIVEAAAVAVSDLARLEGRPAAEYHAVMGLLGRIYAEVDPLYWPARVTEAELLVEKSNLPEAGETLIEALALNPRSSEVWFNIGLLSVETFNFARAANAVEKLRAINPEHVLADVVEVRSYLKQKDVASARRVIEPALLRYPRHRQLGALLAATEAMEYDEAATERALADLDAMAPDSPYPYHVVGEILFTARQYEWGARMLREAIDRAPAWAAPRLVLGLLLMQQGDLPAALEELEKAHAIDAFNSRVNNQLTLVREMIAYPTIHTEHFVIRYAKGPDAVLARDMARFVDDYHDRFTRRFGHEPPVRTQIDIMPDAQHFAVRINGLPDIWTIAACTGDVLALTPPKVGPKQKGHYDWHNVVGHEYVHTITLSQTRNRIPHWFTEACAVSVETTGRTWDQHQLLAWAYHDDKLFSLDQINWGFIRPTQPYERPLAYAQAAWMLEYLTLTHGREAMVAMLELYADGTSNVEAVEQATGESGEAFNSGFKAWAGTRVNGAWGLDVEEPLDEKRQTRIIEALEDPDDADHAAFLDELHETHADHRATRRLIAEWMLEHAAPDQAAAAVRRYAEACPVDPWSYRQRLKLALDRGDADVAIEALTFLDKMQLKDDSHARELMRLHQAAGDLDAARAAGWRALYRRPYDATLREAVAALCLQAGDADEALFHLESLALLEPDRARHHARLAALYHKLGRAEDARAAAERARELDPKAPVQRFLE